MSECYRTNTNQLHNCRVYPHQIILPPGYLTPEHTWFLQEDQCVTVCICVISICFILKFSSSRVLLSSTSSLVCELTFSSSARLFIFPFCSLVSSCLCFWLFVSRFLHVIPVSYLCLLIWNCFSFFVWSLHFVFHGFRFFLLKARFSFSFLSDCVLCVWVPLFYYFLEKLI